MPVKNFFPPVVTTVRSDEESGPPPAPPAIVVSTPASNGGGGKADDTIFPFGSDRADYEGRRTRVVPVEDLVVSNQSKKVSGKSGGVGVVFIKEAMATEMCLSISSQAGGGMEVFCCELVDEESGSCRFKTHSEKKKFKAVDGFYVCAVTRGSKGSKAYTKKFLPLSLVPEAERAVFGAREMSVAEWDREFEETRTKSVFGDQGTSFVKKLRYGETISSMAATPIPKRSTVKTMPGSESSTESTSSWSLLPERARVSEAVELLDLAESLEQMKIAKSPALRNQHLMDVMTLVNKNDVLLKTYAEEVNSDARLLTDALVTKLNILALAGDRIERKLGESDGFGSEFGVTTVFEGLRGLQESYARLDGRMNEQDDWTKLVDQLKTEVAMIKLLADDNSTSLSNMQELWKTTQVDLRLSDMEGTIQASMESLQTHYLGPFSEKFALLFNPNEPRKHVTSQLATLTAQVEALSLGQQFTFPTTGSGGSGVHDYFSPTPASSTSQLDAVLSRLTQVETQATRVEKVLGDVRLETGQDVPQDADDSALRSAVEALTLRLSRLEDDGGDVIVICGVPFHGVDGCAHWLRTKAAFDETNPIILAHDVVSVLHSARGDGTAMTMEALMSRDHHASKGGFRNMSTVRVYASMQQALPGPFAGTGLESLPGLKTFAIWDQQDSHGGKRPMLESGVESIQATLQAMINREMNCLSEAVNVFTELLGKSRRHWQGLAAFLSDNFNLTKNQGADAKEAWAYTSDIVKGLFDELYKVRRIGAERSSISTLTLHDGARLMWGVLQCHRLMDDFLAHQIKGHPLLVQHSLNHVMRNRLSQSDFDKLQLRVKNLEADNKSLTSQLARVKSNGSNGSTGSNRSNNKRDE